MLKKRLNKFLKIDPILIIRDILSDRDILTWIETKNKEQLFDYNEDSEGNKLIYKNIYTGYSSYYHRKQDGVKKNGVPFNVGDPYTIANAGDFYRSIIAKPGVQDLLVFDADPIKVNEEGQETDLFEAFGKDIIGLNEENLQQLIEKVKVKLIAEIRRQVC